MESSIGHVHVVFSRVKRRLAGLVELRRGRPQLDPGFHDDHYLLALVDLLAYECTMFIETGTSVGSTVNYVARRYPHLTCLSCEPDSTKYRDALRSISGLGNVRLYNETSQKLIERILTEYPRPIGQTALCWLDAHGSDFVWPLREEVAFVTNSFLSAYILIDDFKVPGRDWFGYDAYHGQECSFEYIRDALNPALSYGVYYPTYKEKTSRHHPLRGWVLLTHGTGKELSLPASLQSCVQREPEAADEW